MHHLLFPLFLILTSACACACRADFPASVIGISDGDTLTVLSGRTPTRIRLDGIDAPETGQDYGSRSKQLASDLAFGKGVTIRPVTRDRYGRTVAEVILPDGRSLNQEMVGRGAAWWYREYAPRDAKLARLEAEARGARRGLWSQPNPVPPWTWRKGDAAQIEVVGNRSSRVYHRPHCASVARMKESHRVPFKTAAEAEARRYRRAGDCQVPFGSELVE